MVAVKLKLPFPQNVQGISQDPDPDWTVSNLLLSLAAVEEKRSKGVSETKKSPVAFRMCLSDDEFEDAIHQTALVPCNRFGCGELDVSETKNAKKNQVAFRLCLLDDEIEEAIHQTTLIPSLMEKVGTAKSSLFEANHDYRIAFMEEVRNRIAIIEKDVFSENEKAAAALLRIKNYRDARRDAEKKMDTQFHRKIALGLDDYLTDVQREYQLELQIEERRLRNDAAQEEVKRKAVYFEENLRQEKAKAEIEAEFKEEEARQISLEAERKANEAPDLEAAEKINRDATLEAQNEQSKQQLFSQQKEAQLAKPESSGDIIKAAKSALNIEQEKLQKFKDIEGNNQALGMNKDFSMTERSINTSVRQIRTEKSVRSKATELIKILKDPSCPESISTMILAREVVSRCEKPDAASFACAHVIVRVASKVPQLVDILLAELHRACIFTVPKYIAYSESAFESKEAHYKALGFREVEGEIERVDDYLTRLESHMKLYAALVQTEAEGFHNPHGFREGWAWVARFLNALPTNIYTAVALRSFMQMAGYALFRKYQYQFGKILKFISENYLGALIVREDDSKLKDEIAEIKSYIEDNKFLQAPEGSVLQLQDANLSKFDVQEETPHIKQRQL